MDLWARGCPGARVEQRGIFTGQCGKPLYPGETAGEVATMLGDLLHDCRVTDVRVLGGVHGDRDPSTNLTLLFKTDALPASAAGALH